MTFKKELKSNKQVVVGGSSINKFAHVYPPGFSYRVGGIIYTVTKDVTTEANSPMREVMLSDGSKEIMLIDTIRKDIREADCEVLSQDDKPPQNQSKRDIDKESDK